MRYRLVALDLDGTLLNSRKVITPRTRAALQAVQAQGVLPVVVTGRSVHSTHQWSRQIGGEYAICCNGAGLLDRTGALVLHRAIPEAPLQQLLEVAEGCSVVAHCYTPAGAFLDRPLQYAGIYSRWRSLNRRPAAAAGSMLQALWRNRTHLVRSLAAWSKQPGIPPVLKVMLFGEPKVLVALSEHLEQRFPNLQISSSAADNLEVTAARVTKASGLERLAARLKVPREAIIAFGDSENDREMLAYAGLGVAMGNASDPVKSAADRVTASCDEDGVAQVLEELCRP